MAWKNVQYENGKMRTSEGGSGGSSTFADLEDVDLSNLQDGQVPKYNATTGKWENANESGGSGHNYSTTEQVVGTWVDGKPLYEKTIYFNNTAINGGSSFAHNISNVDLVVNMQVLLKVGNTSDMIPVNADATMGNGFRATSTTIEVKGSNTWGALPERYWYFTLQYTKTTD